MAESSKFWNTINVGDGPQAGYDRSAISGWIKAIFGRGAHAGVLRGVLNELAVSGSGSPLSVASGAAVVDGLFYENTAALNLTVTTPGIGTTGGRVVLRANWTAQTVRAVVILSADGTDELPALTQTPGTTYEIGLASFTITTGGVITLTETRGYYRNSSTTPASAIYLAGSSVVGKNASGAGAGAAITASGSGYVLRRVLGELGWGEATTAILADDAVSNLKLRLGTAHSVIGRASNSSGDPADIQAAANNRALARVSSALGYHSISQSLLSGISDIDITRFGNRVADDTKVGSRVVQLRKAELFSTSNDVYTIGYMQCGVVEVVFNGTAHAIAGVNYPENSASRKFIFLTIMDDTFAAICTPVVHSMQSPYFQVRLVANQNIADGTAVNVHWMVVMVEAA